MNSSFYILEEFACEGSTSARIESLFQRLPRPDRSFLFGGTRKQAAHDSANFGNFISPNNTPQSKRREEFWKRFYFRKKATKLGVYCEHVAGVLVSRRNFFQHGRTSAHSTTLSTRRVLFARTPPRSGHRFRDNFPQFINEE